MNLYYPDWPIRVHVACIIATFIILVFINREESEEFGSFGWLNIIAYSLFYWIVWPIYISALVAIKVTKSKRPAFWFCVSLAAVYIVYVGIGLL